MFVFEQFCRDKHIGHFREAFWHWLKSRGVTIINEAILEEHWDAYLTHVTNQMLNSMEVYDEQEDGMHS